MEKLYQAYRELPVRSNEEVFRISDELCREYGLSVVQNPQNKTVSYDKWQGNQKPIASRDFLRMAIDAALRLQPDGFDALMQLLEEIGNGRLKPDVIISHRMKLADAARAYEIFEKKEENCRKIVLTP